MSKQTWNSHIIEDDLFINRMKHLYMLQNKLTMNRVYMEDSQKTTCVT